MTTEVRWLTEGYKYLNVAEIPGAQTSPVIAKWLNELNAWWHDDETAWCGVFEAHCFKSVGIEPPKQWYRAKSWLTWGVELKKPVLGCVVVFTRVGGGHVGMVAGIDKDGGLYVLGGNQDNKVCVRKFPASRVPAGFRYPFPGPATHDPLPILASAADISRSEA